MAKYTLVATCGSDPSQIAGDKVYPTRAAADKALEAWSQHIKPLNRYRKACSKPLYTLRVREF